jgi:Signal transduction histidine kinase
VKIDPNGGFTRYLQDKAPVTAVFYDKKYGLLVSADFILSTFNNSVLKVHGSPDLKRNYRKFFRIDNKVLVASGEGIYEVVKDSVVQITTGNNKLDNSCFALFKMSNDTILVGTDDGLCTLEGNKIVPYHSGDFTIKKNIYFITKTPEGSFWFGTSDGLIRWDGKNRVRDYQTMDGLAGFELNRSAAVVDSDNNFWVGTSNGLSVISLGRMEEVINPPRIWFESVESASGKVYDLKEDNLIPYNDNSLYFNFRGISFVAESKIEYQVMLEGFDKKFYTLRQTQLQSIRYPNLSPGTYRLIVKAKNRLSDWSRPTYSALIMIDKPFYFKIWFILLAITSIFAATVLVLKYLLSTREQTRLEIMVNDRTKALAESEAKLKDTLDNLEEVVEERTSQLEYSNKTKDKLFSIISHDLRSPFLTILGYSEMLAEDIGEMDVTTARSYAERIKSASNRTLELVDTLLEWSRLQIGGLKVEFEVVDLNSIIDEICALALPQAKQKGLTFTQFVQGDISLTTDPSLLKTILRNLVNNAIKFTNQGGEVKLNAFVTQGIVIISVEDNGIGIPKEMLSHLFVMGDLKSRKGTADEKGTGIGLGLVFDLLKLIGGEISVKSTEGEGSSFTVEIPVDQPLSIEEDPGNKSS